MTTLAGVTTAGTRALIPRSCVSAERFLILTFPFAARMLIESGCAAGACSCSSGALSLAFSTFSFTAGMLVESACSSAGLSTG